MVLDDGDQTRTCRQYGVLLIRPSEILVQVRDPSCGIKINSKDFRQLIYCKRSDSPGEALQ
jgi:hypothetical protein